MCPCVVTRSSLLFWSLSQKGRQRSRSAKKAFTQHDKQLDANVAKWWKWGNVHLEKQEWKVSVWLSKWTECAIIGTTNTKVFGWVTHFCTGRSQEGKAPGASLHTVLFEEQGMSV